MSKTLSDQAFKAFAGEYNARFLATADTDGTPNVVLVASMIPVDPTTLIFGQLMLQKTRRNLDMNPRTGFLAVDPQMRIWAGTGDMVQVTNSGPDMDRLNSLSFIRYNAYTGFEAAFRMPIREIQGLGVLSKLNLLFSQAFMPGGATLRQARHGQGIVPPQVMDKFLRIQAVKVVAFMGHDGYPMCRPLIGVGFPAVDRVRLRFPGKGLDSTLAPGTPIALCVVTLDPISYQLKGEVISCNRSGLEAKVTRAFSASPPLAGEDLSAIRLANK